MIGNPNNARRAAVEEAARGSAAKRSELDAYIAGRPRRSVNERVFLGSSSMDFPRPAIIDTETGEILAYATSRKSGEVLVTLINRKAGS